MAKKQPKERPLTPKQLLFVQHYTSHGEGLFNATQAAKLAKYAGSENTLAQTGFQNLRIPKIARAIRHEINKQYSAADLSIERVLNDIEFTRQLAIKDGNHTAALRASELHGKYLRMWLERVEHIHTIEDVTTEELIQAASRLMEKIDGFNLNVGAGGNGSEEGAGADTEGNRTTH